MSGLTCAVSSYLQSHMIFGRYAYTGHSQSSEKSFVSVKETRADHHHEVRLHLDFVGDRYPPSKERGRHDDGSDHSLSSLSSVTSNTKQYLEDYSTDESAWSGWSESSWDSTSNWSCDIFEEVMRRHRWRIIFQPHECAVHGNERPKGSICSKLTVILIRMEMSSQAIIRPRRALCASSQRLGIC